MPAAAEDVGSQCLKRQKRPDNVCDVVARLQRDPLHKLPERYCFTETLDLWTPAEENVIPVIDLSGLSGPNSKRFLGLATEIGKAAQEWGGFQIVNHGLPDSVLKSMRSVGTDFLNLPVEVKERVQNNNSLGYDGRFEHRDQYRNTCVSWAEYLAQTTAVSEVESIRKAVWPSGEDPAGLAFCKAVVEYNEAMHQLKIQLLELLTPYLGVQKDYFSQHFLEEREHYSSWRFKRYPPRCKQASVAGGFAHTDPFLLTIVNQDEVGGLVAYHRGSDLWHSVNPIPGALVVIVGDLMEAWTNGRYRSQVHRVKLTEDCWRLSIIYAFTTPSQFVVSAPSEVVDEEHPRLYIPFTWTELITAIRSFPEEYLKNGSRNQSSLNLVRLKSVRSVEVAAPLSRTLIRLPGHLDIQSVHREQRRPVPAPSELRLLGPPIL